MHTNHMLRAGRRRRLLSIPALVALVTLAACGDSREDSGGTGNTTATGASGGFAAGSTVGVALPSKTSENWVLAGDLFTNGLTDAGYKGDVQYAAATGTVADQQGQIQAMLTNGAKVLIIGAADGGQLGTQLQAAHDAGVTVIAYDRLILNSPYVDYYVAFDNFKVGELQAQSLIEGLHAAKPEGPYNIELFSGSPDDANSAGFFNGAMQVLQPLIDNGELVVASGQTDIKQTAIDGWKAENAQRRMEALLTSTYGDKELDGVLSPNDTLARAIITAVKASGKPIPVLTGQDSEVESVKWIMAGDQYSTIYKDTRALVAQAIKMAQQLGEGQAVDVNDTTTYDNGVKVVPSFLLEPIIVTKANAAEVYANDPTLAPLTK